ncbi:MAG: DHH family phosphoesterase [Hungatella sp.]|nr:DHH family phosphoesterase [Hungatella sp.]MCI9637795.1 DHH family phosphoesterase [Hungatella sp.]
MKEDRKVTGQMGIYLQWPLLLSALIIIMNVIVGAIDTVAGLAMFGFTVLYLILAIFLYVYKRRGIMAGLVEFSAEYAWIQKKLLMDLHIPYAIIDDNGRILWMNTQFTELVKEEKGKGRHLSAIFPDITKETLRDLEDSLTVHCGLGDSRYRVELKPVVLEEGELDHQSGIESVSGEECLITVYVFDETEILRLVQEVTDQRLVAGLIYLDNYEEALSSVEEVRRSLLMALIERKINKYVTRMSGIVRKLEKDKYFFAIEQKYVEELREQRFSILEEVKAVNIGNEMSVTLSIGLGMNGDSYSQNYELARMAMDMALGRGGDQAVLKDREKIEYFGGKSQQQEKTTRVKARVKAHALRELMETKDRLLIMGHKLGDIDSFGASIGIYRIAAFLNKKAHIVINDVTSSVRPMMERFTNNPDYPDDMFLTGERARDMVDANTILVVVDVNRPSITDAPELLSLAKTIVVLDHHRQSSEIITNAVLSYVEPYASSACEMVAEVVQYIADGIRIKPQEADAMYAGIVIDTNNFNNQAGVRTFEAAAYLKRSGADITRVRKMFREEMVDYKAKAEAVRQADVYKGSFAISVCPSEGIENPTIVAAQAANELLEIKGIKASIVMSRYNSTIYLSARSIDEINVQVLMEKLGGGGHRTIAGAQLPGASVEEAKEKLKKAIEEMLEEGEVS